MDWYADWLSGFETNNKTFNAEQKMNYKTANIFENKNELELFLKTNEEPVVVIMEAAWCGSCQIMDPIFERIERLYKEKINFVLIDTDSSEEISKEYGLDKLPSVLFYNEGNLIDQITGTVSYDALNEKMKTLLKDSTQNNMYNLK